jgi:nitronate monooxygenase
MPRHLRCDLTDLRYPIVLSPMGGVGTPELAAAVSNAGGLGSLAAAYLTPAQITAEIRRTRELTDQPFAVNLFVQEARPLVEDAGRALAKLAVYHREMSLPAPSVPQTPCESYGDQIAAVLAERVAVFNFTFGVPSAEVLNAFRSAGTLVIGTATTVDEAVALAGAGVDAISLQGAEAGAHRGTFLGSFEKAMVAQSREAVKLPLIAAGGIRDGNDLLEMRKLGAAAVQMGTAFIPCPESGAADVYKRAVLSGVSAGDTVVTRAFSGRPARGIPNHFIREVEASEGAILPFPWQNAVTRPLRNAASKAGRAEFISLWAGEGRGALREEPAAELVRRVVKEAGL